MAAQQLMMLHVMNEMMMLGKAIEGSRRARCVEEKVVEGVGEISGGNDTLKADASAMERDSTGSVLGGSPPDLQARKKGKLPNSFSYQ